MTEIRIPEMLNPHGSTEWTVVSWVFADGATVPQGELVCEVMMEKTTVEIEAPASGQLRIVQQADAVVKTGDLIGHIEE
jgi:pyruvate/2-oxoglutarate dehydrogenase complex dihydrolipoamide acyltransferase (E2) component